MCAHSVQCIHTSAHGVQEMVKLVEIKCIAKDILNQACTGTHLYMLLYGSQYDTHLYK